MPRSGRSSSGIDSEGVGSSACATPCEVTWARSSGRAVHLLAEATTYPFPTSFNTDLLSIESPSASSLIVGWHGLANRLAPLGQQTW